MRQANMRTIFLVVMAILTGACGQYEFDRSYFGGEPPKEDAEIAPSDRQPQSKKKDDKLASSAVDLPSMQSVTDLAAARFETKITTQAQPQAQGNGVIHTRLASEQFPGLYKHFSADLLASVKVVITEALPLPRPADFAANPSIFKALGLDLEAIDNDTMAITYDQTIYIKPQYFASKHENVLFHEMIHVLQYKELGRKQFALWYSYFHITRGNHNPLEEMAYKLDAAFLREDVLPADIHAYVRLQLQGMKPHI